MIEKKKTNTKSYCSLYLLPIKEASIDKACLFLAAYKNKGQGHLSQIKNYKKVFNEIFIILSCCIFNIGK